jgi:2-keto-4-pentenoate hydratase/2-oxohepta-3-ene-1,7-dioic acid hydratase in catechol pathway
MRLSTVHVAGHTAFGPINGEVLHDVSGTWPDLASALAAGTDAITKAAASAPTVALASAAYALPIPNPRRILCVGLNYAAHRAESSAPVSATENPAIFVRFPSSLCGHEQPIVRPHVSTAFDYEGELAVVIGKTCRYVSEAEALNYVAGYSLFMDGTLRDYQRHTSQFTPGKSFEQSGGFGPTIVTPDEFDASTAQLTTTVSGIVRQDAPISDMIHSTAAIIAYCSQWTTLEPGDVIATGTPSGVGYARDPQVLLVPGDVVEVSITGLGTLRNHVIDESL